VDREDKVAGQKDSAEPEQEQQASNDRAAQQDLGKGVEELGCLTGHGSTLHFERVLKSVAEIARLLARTLASRLPVKTPWTEH
jgi:hypothetical protein